MNEQEKMTADLEPRIARALAEESFAEEPMPERLHGKIMKRVFLAGYGKYLAFSASILALNLGVLGMDLYRTFRSTNVSEAMKTLRDSFALTPDYLASAAGTLYRVLPLQSIIATVFTAAFSAYIAVVFVRVYRNPHGVKLMKGRAEA